MRRNACSGVAPRSAAASMQPVVERGEARLHDDDHERDAERDVREDHGRQMLELASARSCLKNAGIEMPMTTSGITSETKTSVE